jgi:hypothetical protein
MADTYRKMQEIATKYGGGEQDVDMMISKVLAS